MITLPAQYSNEAFGVLKSIASLYQCIPDPPIELHHPNVISLSVVQLQLELLKLRPPLCFQLWHALHAIWCVHSSCKNNMLFTCCSIITAKLEIMALPYSLMDAAIGFGTLTLHTIRQGWYAHRCRFQPGTSFILKL